MFFSETYGPDTRSCPGTVSISDDIVVVGKDKEEHDKNIRKLTEKAREHGFVFSPVKCKISTKIIKFFSLVSDEKGVHPDPNKVKDIKKYSSLRKSNLHEPFFLICHKTLLP